MKLPLSWLSDYTDMNGITPKEYDAKLTMSGSKVEEVYYLGAEIDNVVTGKILEVVDHPDSDHLKICQLDVGKEEPVQIVTGAPNVTPASVGEICPVCLHKSTLPGGVKITKGKLRGEVSNGMMCSFQELGLTPVEAEKISVPAIRELPLTLECKVVYKQEQDPDQISEKRKKIFYPADVDGSFHGANRDYHTAYYGQILSAYILED